MNFKYSYNNKRYHTLDYHLKDKFKTKVFKVSLNAGFTCPNIDGKVTYGGCTFCSTKGSGDFAGNPSDDLVKQFNEIKERMHKKWPEGKYIGYFQAYSNTYAPLDVLKEKYETVLKLPDVVGLSIATRPDCLEDDVIEYLGELNKRTYLWVELGLQSAHERTAKMINRGHDLKTFIEGVKKLRKHNINVCVHIINGLPLEDKEMMIETARVVSKMDIQGVKIHLLHVLENTPMAVQYNKGKFDFLTREEYVDIVCDQLELIPEDVIIHRVTGDGAPDELIGPDWSLKKFIVLNEIDKEMKRRDSYQGIKYKEVNI